MSRYSFFLMLNTVNLPTGSAWGKSALASWTSFQRAFLATRYQRISGTMASGCLSPAATRRFFEMMCTGWFPGTAEPTQGEYSFQIENGQDVGTGTVFNSKTAGRGKQPPPAAVLLPLATRHLAARAAIRPQRVLEE